MTPAERLRALGAHQDLVGWAETQPDWRALWQTCPRGDWLLGIAAELGADPRAITRAACACARVADDQIPDGMKGPHGALAAAESWARSEGTAQDCAGAADRAEQALDRAPDPAAQSAIMAAVAAARSVEDPAVAATAAASAAQASILDAGDCATMSALQYAQSECARRVREVIPFDSLPPG